MLSAVVPTATKTLTTPRVLAALREILLVPRGTVRPAVNQDGSFPFPAESGLVSRPGAKPLVNQGRVLRPGPSLLVNQDGSCPFPGESGRVSRPGPSPLVNQDGFCHYSAEVDRTAHRVHGYLVGLQVIHG